MRQNLFGVVATGLFCAFLAAAPARAHHSYAGFSGNEPISVHGTITAVRLKNPHSWLFVETKDTAGKPVKWKFEAGRLSRLFQNGVKRGVIKAGDEVTIKGFRASNAADNEGVAHQVIMADGHVYTVGPAKIPAR